MMDDGVKERKKTEQRIHMGHTHSNTHTHSILAPLLCQVLSTEWWLSLRFFMYLTWLCPSNQLSTVES